jgi:photoprotection regulator FRP-like protein
MNFRELRWSPSEKKVARGAFDAALEAALGKALAELKRKANAATIPSDMWEIEDYLRQQRRKLDEMFDYRYSQLPFVFARLIREGYLDKNLLVGLSEDKWEEIRSLVAWSARE